jgi:hypothetical protein
VNLQANLPFEAEKYPMKSSLELQKISILMGFAIAALSSPANAAQLIQDSGGLGSNDAVNWSSLGKVFNPAIPGPPAFLPFSIDAISGRGLSVNASLTPKSGITPPFVFRNARPPNGIPANFAPNDFVLFTGLQPGTFPAPGNPGPLTLRFDQPVFGAGAQFSVDDTLSFTAFIDAYDRNDQLIGQFSRPGTGSISLDGSAVFLGVRSDEANIAKVVFRSSEPNRAIGIGTLIIAAVPEPGALPGLMVAGLGWTIGRKRSRRQD